LNYSKESESGSPDPKSTRRSRGGQYKRGSIYGITPELEESLQEARKIYYENKEKGRKSEAVEKIEKGKNLPGKQRNGRGENGQKGSDSGSRSGSGDSKSSSPGSS
jgi:hypothetical protein